MSDPRLIPANGRVAAAELQGQVTADRFAQGKVLRVCQPVADLRVDATAQGLDRQLLYGDAFRVLETRDGLAFGQAERGGYVGYVLAMSLSDAPKPTHHVTVRSTLMFAKADIKYPSPVRLSLGACVAVIRTVGVLAETPKGFIPADHLAPISAPEKDPVAVAERLLGTPYLWGGNSADGIDCSGLVQLALLACGINCPGDSDQQRAAFDAVEVATRGDLLFWQGHVAMCIDAETLIHANGHHMAVAVEDRATCIARILASENKPVLKIARPRRPT